MYRGYNLTLSNSFTPLKHATFLETGRNLADAFSKQTRNALNSYFESGVIDGGRLRDNWFPIIKADIFISHSHQDVDLANGLAGWLAHTFKLKAFIDSAVWGYADDLLKLIDDKYCKNPGGGTYSYEKRNGSTSHVHMMLSTALTAMIDQSECLFFLNTPNSVAANESIDKTKSPWIYSELETSSVIRKQLPERQGMVVKAAKSTATLEYRSDLTIEYPANIEHLTNLTEANLTQWNNEFNGQSASGRHALDFLYKNT